jgi:dTDP-4-amino-4,6-dideoxygalactose transaminase
MFDNPKSTSNLRQPDFERFMSYVSISLDQNRLSNRGPNVLTLERRLAAFHDVAHCVTFCSGFYALAVCLKIFLGQKKSNVLLPSLTYRRMPDILSWVSATPIYVDVSKENFCLSANVIKKLPIDSYDLILAPHPVVNCLDAFALEEHAIAKGKPIIFDSVESAYETINGKRVGGFGEAEIFSLHACKLINGFGGGYVTTNNPQLAQRLINISKFGFEHEDIITDLYGNNLKLNEFHAAMALANLDEVEEQIQHNKMIYQTYCVELEAIDGLEILRYDEKEKNSFKNIVVRFNDDWPLDISQTVAELNSKNILARRYYHPPLHKRTMKDDNNFPITDNLASQLLNMPCGSFVTCSDVKIICEKLKLMAVNET